MKINQSVVDIITLFDDYDLEVLEFSLLDNFIVYKNKKGMIEEIPYEDCKNIFGIKK